MFAAASLKNALDDVNAAFTKATGIKVVVELRGELGARQADRTRRAGRHAFISADLRLDGLCRPNAS